MPLHLTHGRVARGLGAAVLSGLVAMTPATAVAARQGVYGGVTKAGDPIVITSDARAKKITGAVFRIRVDGKDNWWPFGERVKVRSAPNPNRIPTDVLIPARNARGRFDSSLVTRLSDGSDNAIMAGIRLAGSLKPRKATGTIRGWVTVTDPATGELSGSYQTKLTKWTAERAAGRVYGGATAADLPIVVKLDRRRAKVADLILSCYGEESAPAVGFWSSSEWLVDFPLTGGRFGDTFSYQEKQAGGTVTYDWKVAGRVTAKAATGTFALTVNGTQTSGEPFGIQMPATAFTATTG